MRIALYAAVGMLAAAALPPAVIAQTSRRPYERYSTPASILASRPIVAGRVPPRQTRVLPSQTAISIQSTVTVPDGGTASLGGYSSMSEGRSEYGAPLVGKLPLVGRGFRNIGYGRSVRSSRVTVGVRIISLREEEERQTGFRSP
jgi:Flp pilus assembly secretin CpaC